MASVISGLGSGIDLQAIVSQLMAAERQPEQKILALKSTATTAQTGWTNLAGYISSLKTAATALNTSTKVSSSTATSSDTTAMTATATSGAQLGSLGVSIGRLATAQQLSSGALTGPNMLVGAGSAFITSGLSSLGATALRMDGTVSAGVHRLQVTQASAAAQAVATAVPALDYTGASDLSVTSSAGTVAVTLGTYATSQDLLTSLNTQLAGVATASLVAGQVRIASLDEGSGASLTLSGGATASLGLTAATTTGGDAKVSWDGTTSTISHITSGTPLTVATGVTLTPTGHLSLGSASTTVIQTTATSTLADLNAQIGASGGPATAALVDTGDGTSAPLRLILAARSTGTAGQLTISGSGISVLAAGQLSTVSAAQDAQLTVGGTTVTRSSNTVTDLIPGVTLGLLKQGTTVNLDVSRDTATTATAVGGLVSGINALLSNVSSLVSYNATTKSSGPLAGNSGARALPGTVLSIFSGTVGTGSTTALSQLGIQTNRDGTLSFDSATFTARMASDPSGVADLVSSFATKLVAFTNTVTDVDGAVTLGKKNAGAEIKRRQDQIDAFEVRLTRLQSSYSAKFAALDAALGSLKQQQTRLAGMIGNL
jgi:flagellar hook-associated protein 2